MVVLSATECCCTLMTTFGDKSLLESLAWDEIAGIVAGAFRFYNVVTLAVTFMALSKTSASTFEQLPTYLVTFGHRVSTLGPKFMGWCFATIASLDICWIELAFECGR